MTQEMTLRLAEHVDVALAERTLDALCRGTTRDKLVLIDFRDCQKIDLGAGYRLGNALRLVAERNFLRVQVRDEDFARGASSDWYWLFTRTGLGPSIAAHAKEVMSANRNVVKNLKDYYQRTLEVPAQNTVYFPDVHLERLDVENETRFTKTLLDQFRFMNVQSSAFDTNALTGLMGLCFESAQNTVDHAAKKPLAPATKINSYLSLRYHRRLDGASDGAIAGYSSRLSKSAKDPESFRLLEIVVNDDGVGIPARHALQFGIYEGRVAAEEEVLSDALRKSSVKLQAGDAKIRGGVAGLGFPRIRDSLRSLGGFASIRTGRCFATFDGLSPIQDLFRLNRDTYGLPLSLMPGTTLQIVIPFHSNEKEVAASQRSLL